ncbi:hypothetical protein [Clostridium sp.]|uniref:hypothetical protein n=1 Tax=Clostridium sp. TaxID=1506 RepID=UPI0035A12533
MIQKQSWEITDEFWKEVKNLIPEQQRDPNNEIQGIDWEWLSIDGSMNKAPRAKEFVGADPTDREKNGSKKHILADGRGVPLSVVVTGQIVMMYHN